MKENNVCLMFSYFFIRFLTLHNNTFPRHHSKPMRKGFSRNYSWNYLGKTVNLFRKQPYNKKQQKKIPNSILMMTLQMFQTFKKRELIESQTGRVKSKQFLLG